MSIAQQLRDAITSSGLPFNTLAEQSGVDAGQISRFMAGKRDMQLESAGKLISALGLKLCKSRSKQSR